MITLRSGALLAAALAGAAAAASDEINARCATTDDGAYPCHFRTTDGSGSFAISAAGRPTYMLNISEPGVAYGFVDVGEGSVALPGRYLRSRDDRACWRNDTTRTEICAW
jgi:hypothetical protein